MRLVYINDSPVFNSCKKVCDEKTLRCTLTKALQLKSAIPGWWQAVRRIHAITLCCVCRVYIKTQIGMADEMYSSNYHVVCYLPI